LYSNGRPRDLPPKNPEFEVASHNTLKFVNETT
jgi:hypothetical protein